MVAVFTAVSNSISITTGDSALHMAIDLVVGDDE